MQTASDFDLLSLDGATEDAGRSEINPLSCCPTGEVFTRALQNFREILFDRIGQQEDEVFSLRARFLLRRNEDKEHFERARRKRQRAQAFDKRQKRNTHRKSEWQRNEKLTNESEDEALRQFEDDQKKLYVEHEEELQQQFPLAFLDEASASVMAFSLFSMLKSNMLSLAHSRTVRYKETHSTSLKTSAQDEANNASPPDHHASEKATDQTQHEQPHPHPHPEQKPKQNAAASKTSQSLTAVKVEDEHLRRAAALRVGRGAFLSAPAPLLSRAGEHTKPPRETKAERRRAGPAWAARLAGRGAADFARRAMESSRARNAERMRAARAFVEEAALVSQHKEANRVMEELKAEERRVMAAHEEKMNVWREAVREMPQSTPSEELDKGATEKEPSRGTHNDNHNTSQTRVQSEPCSESDEAEDTVKADNDPIAVSTSPSNLICTQRRVRMEHLTASALSFDTEHWSEITLGSDDELESKAREYIWPQRLEDHITHVICGEATKNVKRWLIARPRKTRETQGEESEKIGSEDDKEEKDGYHPDVVAFPRAAGNVWLRVDGIGEFVAHEFRFAAD